MTMSSPPRMLLSMCLAIIVASCAASFVYAEHYSFTRVTYTANVFNNAAAPVPSLNNSGFAAFRASLISNAAASGVYKGDGGPLTTIFDSVQDNTFWGGFDNYPAINDQGTVAFNARRSGAWGIYSGDGGPVSTIIAPGDFSVPGIANDNSVVYSTSTATTSDLYSGSGGPVISLFASGPANAIGNPSVSDNGRVAFTFNGLNGATRGVYVTGPNGSGPLTTISTVGNLGYGYDNIATNDSGLVAMTAHLAFFSQGVYLGDGGALTTVADRTGPYDTFGSISINNLGHFAFSASLDSGPAGIFTSADPISGKIIQTGDSLDGSTVTRISFGNSALNDAGQVAFYALLADGRRGVYIASVPEASTFILAGLGGVLALGYRVIRRTSKPR